MIDIHTHILYGLDDGSKDYLTSLKMLEMEKNDGVKTIVLTPHISYHKNMDYLSKETINSLFFSFKEQFKSFNIDFILGSEIYYTDDTVYGLKNNLIQTINDTNIILVEFSLNKETHNIEDAVYRLIVNGYKVILAHPERYDYLSIPDVIRIKSLGAKIQVNSASILGLAGSKKKKKALKLLKMELVDYVSSDCHNDTTRPPNLKEAMDYLEKKHLELNKNNPFIF